MAYAQQQQPQQPQPGQQGYPQQPRYGGPPQGGPQYGGPPLQPGQMGGPQFQQQQPQHMAMQQQPAPFGAPGQQSGPPMPPMMGGGQPGMMPGGQGQDIGPAISVEDVEDKDGVRLSWNVWLVWLAHCRRHETPYKEIRLTVIDTQQAIISHRSYTYRRSYRSLVYALKVPRRPSPGAVRASHLQAPVQSNPQSILPD